MASTKIVGLKRDLGVWSASAIVVGSIIGSGIFLVPKAMILQVGSPGMVFVVWIVGALLSLGGALTYAELGAAFPEAGGEIVYLKKAYGSLVSFLFGWTQVIVAGSGSIAALAAGFVLYLANFYPVLDTVMVTVGPVAIRYGQLFAAGLIAGLSIVNYFGVKLGGEIQVATTVVKAAAIGAIVLIGATASQGSVANLTSSTPAVGGVSGFFAALVAALWAYDGWNNVTKVSGEVKNPQRNLPLALILGTLGVVALYLVANFAYFYVLSSQEVASSDRVAAEMMRRLYGPTGAAVISVAAMISIFSALNASVLANARVPYAMAMEGMFFRSVSKVSPDHSTPSVALFVSGLWAVLLVLSGTYDQLFNYVIFASWIFYGLAGFSVIVLRRTQPEIERPCRTLGYPVLPVLFVLGALALVGNTLYNEQSRTESVIGLLGIIAGIPFYWFWRNRYHTD